MTPKSSARSDISLYLYLIDAYVIQYQSSVIRYKFAVLVQLSADRWRRHHDFRNSMRCVLAVAKFDVVVVVTSSHPPPAWAEPEVM